MTRAPIESIAMHLVIGAFALYDDHDPNHTRLVYKAILLNLSAKSVKF